MLDRCIDDTALMKRWMLAYWCFYHAGVASNLARQDAHNFWHLFRYANMEWPRGRERRHFRGRTSDAATSYLAEKFPHPESAIDYLLRGGSASFETVADRIRRWPGFGQWAAFKAADMLERCLGVPIDFSDCPLHFYSEPVAGARIVYPELPIRDAVPRLLDLLATRTAPPDYKRPLGVQEAETVFCKYKAHFRGHYPIGIDTKDMRAQLKGWGSLADSLLKLVPTPSGRPPWQITA
jgi:hypothetical protein